MFSIESRFYLTYEDLRYRYDSDTMAEYRKLFNEVMCFLEDKLKNNNFDLSEEEADKLAELYSIVEECEED